MRRSADFIGGLLLLAGLSLGGEWLRGRLALAMPGPVIGMLGYLVLLLATPWADWSLPAARWLASMLGALIIPALIGIALFAGVVAGGGWRLALVLLLSTAVTGVATALLFRAVGGRA